MSTLFGQGPHLDWWQECDRAVVVFFFGLLMVRLSGRRTFSKWSALDTIVSIVVGSSLSRAVTGSAPLFPTIGASALLVFLHWTLAKLAAKSAKLSSILEGAPITLGRNGSADRATMLRHSVSRSDLEEALRQVSVGEESGTSRITLEPSGKITILKA
jgi:uncharacterized membrane protein YcaP (DUF421 family)